MFEVQNYLIHEDTMVLMTEYDSNGDHDTRVLEKVTTFKAKGSPTTLMDFYLKYLGNSFRGAIDGSKAILGKTHMYPIILNERLGIIFFPTKAPTRDDCVWFNLKHVKLYIEYEKDRTLVTLTDNHTIVVDVSFNTFKSQINKAYTLQARIIEHSTDLSSVVKETSSSYHFTKKKGKLNYHFKLKKD